jgi:hypothetical protein
MDSIFLLYFEDFFHWVFAPGFSLKEPRSKLLKRENVRKTFIFYATISNLYLLSNLSKLYLVASRAKDHNRLGRASLRCIKARKHPLESVS